MTFSSCQKSINYCSTMTVLTQSSSGNHFSWKPSLSFTKNLLWAWFLNRAKVQSRCIHITRLKDSGFAFLEYALSQTLRPCEGKSLNVCQCAPSSGKNDRNNHCLAGTVERIKGGNILRSTLHSVTYSLQLQTESWMMVTHRIKII